MATKRKFKTIELANKMKIDVIESMNLGEKLRIRRVFTESSSIEVNKDGKIDTKLNPGCRTICMNEFLDMCFFEHGTNCQNKIDKSFLESLDDDDSNIIMSTLSDFFILVMDDINNETSKKKKK